MPDKSLIFIFLDGVGISGEREETNPFRLLASELIPFYFPIQKVVGLPFRLKAIDAVFGVPGIPQSGSGQTTLFTGIPYPRISGEHSGSYPTREMRRLLSEHNLLKQVIAKGHRARFFNAYPYHADLFQPPHLSLDESGTVHFSQDFPTPFRRRISATTAMMLSIGQKPSSEQDIQREQSLYQDFSNRSLIARGADLPELSPKQAGTILGRAGSALPGLTLYEFFLSDQTGHRGRLDDAVTLVRELEVFVSAVCTALDPNRHAVLICSDHGNIEEMDHPGHSRNPVPLWVWGHRRNVIADRIESIADVTPSIVRYFEED